MTFMNPIERSCWRTCRSCMRCADKGRYSACASCSGRNDPSGTRLPDADDYCSCAEGVLRYKTQKGRLIVTKFPGNPYGGDIRADTKSADEQDWDRYLYEQRSRLDDENWDPIQFLDGKSTSSWLNQYQR